MKPCLICHTENPADAVTCSACGEGSFGPVTNEQGATLLNDGLGAGNPSAAPERRAPTKPSKR